MVKNFCQSVLFYDVKIIFCPNEYQQVKLFWGKKAKKFEKKLKIEKRILKKKKRLTLFFLL
jgi:hypothetical protein